MPSDNKKQEKKSQQVKKNNRAKNKNNQDTRAENNKQVKKHVQNKEYNATKPVGNKTNGIANPGRTKKFIRSPGFWITVVFITAIIFLVVIIATNQSNTMQYTKIVDDYQTAVNERKQLKTQVYDAITNLTKKTEGFGGEYGNLTDTERDEVESKCFQKLGFNFDSIEEVKVYDNIRNEKLGIAEIKALTEKLEDANNVLHNTVERIGECSNLVSDIGAKHISDYQAKKAEEARQEEEKRKKQEQQAEERRQREAEQAKQKITYYKFVNQIKEGMTIDEVRSIYGGFSSQCELSGSYAGWTNYTCDVSQGSDIAIVSFSFYKGKLESKYQTGLK